MINSRNAILNYFRILKKRGLVGTSYLFIGENNFLEDIAKTVSCRESENFCDNCWDCRKIDDFGHPDLMVLEPQGATLKIEQVKEGIRFLTLRSFRLDKKILVLRKAQSFSREAANAFLKTLEEPPRGAFIALCVSKTEDVIPTIASRCRKIYLSPEEPEVDRACKSTVYNFLEGQDFTIRDREKFASFLTCLIAILREKLLSAFSEAGGSLPGESRYEIILNSYPPRRLGEILKDLLRIYDAHRNININLALNMIRLKMGLVVSA